MAHNNNRIPQSSTRLFRNRLTLSIRRILNPTSFMCQYFFHLHSRDSIFHLDLVILVDEYWMGSGLLLECTIGRNTVSIISEFYFTTETVSTYSVFTSVLSDNLLYVFCLFFVLSLLSDHHHRQSNFSTFFDDCY